jgi:hypothetical protein
VHRRTLLRFVGAGIGAGVFLSGCTSEADPDGQPTSTTQPTPVEDVDNPLRTSTQAHELALISLYDQAISLYPQLAGQLRPLADQHRQHFEALAVPGATPESTPDPDTSGSPTSSDTALPGDALSLPANDASGALAALTAAERVAADQRTDACVDAQSVTLARVLALIAASEASHAEALSRSSVS